MPDDASMSPPPAQEPAKPQPKPSTAAGCVGLLFIIGVIYGGYRLIAPHLGAASSTASGAAPASASTLREPKDMTLADINEEIERLTNQQVILHNAITSAERSVYDIIAEVKEKDGNTLRLWGKAISKTGQMEDGSMLEDGNLIVRDADLSKLSGTYYLGQAWFSGKTSGKNAFGADVPVHIFSAEPPKTTAGLRHQQGAFATRLQALYAAKESKEPKPAAPATTPEAPATPVP